MAADPRFAKAAPEWPAPNDYRLGKGSSAINAGVALPADWPDSRKDQDADKPDIGALPNGAKPFAVGRLAAP